MNHSSTDTTSFPSISPSQKVAISLSAFLVIAILAGTVGNARVCIVLRSRRDLRKVPHFLFANLSLTGLLSSLITMPVYLAVTIVNYFSIRRVSLELVCKTGFTSGMGFSVLNALTLSLMAIDRYDCVIRPFKRRLATFNIKKVIFVCWILVSLLVSIHGVMLSKESSVCSRMDPYTTKVTSSGSHAVSLYTAFLGTIPNLATGIIIVFTIFPVVKKLRSSPVCPRSSQALQRRQENELTKLTCRLFAVFLISWLPVMIFNAVTRVSGFREPTVKIVLLSVVVISNFNYVLNPILHFKILRARLPVAVRLRSLDTKVSRAGKSFGNN